MTSSRPPVTLEYRRIEPTSPHGAGLHVRGVWVLVALVGMIVMMNLIMLLLLFL